DGPFLLRRGPQGLSLGGARERASRRRPAIRQDVAVGIARVGGYRGALAHFDRARIALRFHGRRPVLRRRRGRRRRGGRRGRDIHANARVVSDPYLPVAVVAELIGVGEAGIA